jgi:hypothetical protein
MSGSAADPSPRPLASSSTASLSASTCASRCRKRSSTPARLASLPGSAASFMLKELPGKPEPHTLTGAAAFRVGRDLAGHHIEMPGYLACKPGRPYRMIRSNPTPLEPWWQELEEPDRPPPPRPPVPEPPPPGPQPPLPPGPPPPGPPPPGPPPPGPQPEPQPEPPIPPEPRPKPRPMPPPEPQPEPEPPSRPLPTPPEANLAFRPTSSVTMPGRTPAPDYMCR